jgi:hypothetical protein
LIQFSSEQVHTGGPWRQAPPRRQELAGTLYRYFRLYVKYYFRLYEVLL